MGPASAGCAGANTAALAVAHGMCFSCHAIAAGITGAAVSMISAIVLYATDPDQSRVMALYVLAVSGWLLLRMLVTLRSPGSIPRPDPYMTDADVFRTRRQRLRVLFIAGAVVGIAFTVLLMFKAG